MNKIQYTISTLNTCQHYQSIQIVISGKYLVLLNLVSFCLDFYSDYVGMFYDEVLLSFINFSLDQNLPKYPEATRDKFGLICMKFTIKI